MSESDDADDRIEFAEIFRAELDQHKQRWASAFTGEREGERSTGDGDEPTTEHGLVGVGLSGGGIRSATFNLGVLQALVRRGVFDHVDYLSTVSGGGYLGSSISAGMRNRGDEFPLEYVWGADEKPQVNWLRNHSDYLTGGGVVDWGRIVASLVRGILLNFLILVPVLLGAALLVDVLYRDQLLHWALVGGIDWSEVFRFTRWAGLGVLGLFVMYAPAATIIRMVSTRRSASGGVVTSLVFRDRIERAFSYALGLIILVAVFELLPLIIHGYHSLLDNPAIRRDYWTGISGVVSVIAGVAAGPIAKSLSGYLRTAAMYVIGGLGMLLPLILILIAAENLIYQSGFIHDAAADIAMEPRVLVAIVAGAVLVFCSLFVDINLTSIHGLYRDRLANAYLIGKSTGDSLAVQRDVLLSELNQPGSVAPYHLINTAMNLQGSSDPNIRERLSSHFVFARNHVGGEHCGYARTTDVEAVCPDMSLSTAMAISAAAAAPNMGSFTTPILTALMTLFNIRMGFWCPNPRKLTPWAARRQRPWEDGRRGTTAAQLHRLRWSVPPRLLLSEMSGAVHDDGDWVNVSDGGHIENLATVELLRRRCKYIIIGDAEADPTMRFGGLAVLIRTARLDLGVEIRIAVDDLRLDDGHSERHAAVGRIIYPPRVAGGEPEQGWLLFLKLSVTGDEDEMIREYRARNPAFPHESTADQFFDEGQFEAYRALGFHVVDRLFEPLRADSGRQTLRYDELDDWFRQLRESLAPQREASRLEAELEANLSSIRRDMAADWYQDAPAADADVDSGMLSFSPGEELVEPAPPEPVSAEAVDLIGRQLVMMDKAFSRLGLDAAERREYGGNVRWMRMFGQWAATPLFRRVWDSEKTGYSRQFQAFVDELLARAD